MSLSKNHTANLPGYGAPIYPELVNWLVQTYTRYSPVGLGAKALEDAARRCSGFLSVRTDVVTADGYVWLRGLEFSVDGGSVLIAMPHATDGNFRNGAMLDRSPAVYVKGDRARQNALTTARNAVDRLTRALRFV